MVANKKVLCKHFNIQPSELERMPFWEYEMSIKECEKIAEEEKKQQEDESGKYNMHNYNPSNYQKQANRMMSNQKMPSMPKMPSVPRI